MNVVSDATWTSRSGWESVEVVWYLVSVAKVDFTELWTDICELAYLLFRNLRRGIASSIQRC